MRTQTFSGMAMAALLVGCASTSGAQSEPTTSAATASAHKHGMGMMADMCPMQVPGATVTSADIEGGKALAFTTSAGDVAELRKRVGGMAEMHNRHADGGMMMGAGAEHEAGPGAAPGHKAGEHGGMMMPAATTSVEDIDDGARLILRPKDPAQLEALRKHARMHAERMASGECPMMSHGAKGRASASPSAGDEAHP